MFKISFIIVYVGSSSYFYFIYGSIGVGLYSGIFTILVYYFSFSRIVVLSLLTIKMYVVVVIVTYVLVYVTSGIPPP